MTEKIPVQAEIGVKDDTAGPVAVIAARFRNLTKPLAGLGQSFGGVGDSVKRLGASFADVAKPLGALTAAFSVAGIIESAKHFIEYGGGMADTASKYGAAAKSLYEWSYAAEQSDVSQESLLTGVKRLNRALSDVARGKNKDLPILFQHLGISMKDADGHLKTTEQLMPDIADAMQKLHSPIARSTLATMAFGKAGEELIPFLENGSADLKANAEEAQKLGLVLDTKATSAAKRFGDSITRLVRSFSGLQNSIGSAIIPALQPLIDMFTDWIIANRELIATKVGDFIKSIVTQVRAIDWAAIGKQIVAIKDAIVGFIENTVGWKVAIGAMVALMNIEMISAFLNVGKALTVMSAQFYLVFGAPLVAMLGDFVVALRAGYGVMQAFNLMVAANPVGLLVIGITAAVAAIAGLAYVIYRNWEPIKAWFAALWEDVKKVFVGFGEFLAGVFTLDFTRVFDGLKALGQGIVDFWKGIFGGLIDTFKSTIGWITDNLGSTQPVAAGGVGTMPGQFAGGRGPLGPRVGMTAPAANAATPANGQVNVVIDFRNMPQGVTATTATQGPAIGNVEVGKSRQGVL